MNDLSKVMKGYLEEYNLENKSPMSLVMFPYLMQHVSRLSRVLKQDSGHALLIGFAGSGRQSATRLATFMARYELFQVGMGIYFHAYLWNITISLDQG